MMKVTMHDAMKAYARGLPQDRVGSGRTGRPSRSSLVWLIMRVRYFDGPEIYRLWQGTFARGNNDYLAALRR